MGLIPSAAAAGAGTIMGIGGVMIGIGVVGCIACELCADCLKPSGSNSSLAGFRVFAQIGQLCFALIAIGGIVVTAVPLIGIVVCAVASRFFGN
jgi:hypothetical protein